MPPARILIVEDEPIVAKDLQLRLRRMGYAALPPVSTGEAALAFLERESADLALMDIMLAGELDGIETAEKLRARWSLPVVFLTALSDEATLQRAKRTTPFGYLLKPFEERELYTAVEVALYKHQTDAELQATQRALNAQLERKVEERTRQLEEANRELAQVAFIAAHTLQEPVRTVSNFAQLLLRRHAEQLNQEAQEVASYVVKGSRQMYEVALSLLDYLEVATHRYQFAETDLNAVLRRVLSDLRGTIRGAGADITADPLPTATADAHQMARVFRKLLENAMTYRGTNPPKIHIAARRENAEWVISVRDNGSGIDPDEFESIFRMFQRIGKGDDVRSIGTGLAICRKILEAHGGRIWVESETGEGSNFYFSLPVSA